MLALPSFASRQLLPRHR